MGFGEKCGVCRREIPDGVNIYKFVMMGWLATGGYETHDILHICYICFTDILLGGIRVRKGKDLGIDEDAE